MHQRLFHASLRVLFALLGSGCTITPPSSPPEVALSVPAPFGASPAIKHYRAGEDILNSPPYRLTTVAPMTEYSDSFGPKDAPQADNHSWRVRVYARFSPKVAAAYASATDGFQADLNEAPEFLGLDERSYMYARFERKHFRWGNAVSFFSQFTQDTGIYVPHNGHLRYEVWGITPDRKYTIVAHLSVSHPKLGDWGEEVRDARDLDPRYNQAVEAAQKSHRDFGRADQIAMEALKNDRDYKLVETCSPDEFEPSLTAFDKMLDTLVIR